MSEPPCSIDVRFTVEASGNCYTEVITFNPGEWQSMSMAEREDTMLAAIDNQMAIMGIYTGWEVVDSNE